jgi:tight adherence protein B
MGVVLIPILLAVAAGAGVHLLVTPRPEGRRSRPAARLSMRHRASDWLVRAGLGGVSLVEFAAVVGVMFIGAALLAFALFGGVVAGLVVGVFAASWPLSAYRRRGRSRRELAMEAWPRLIEEIRILTTSAGRSIPQALFEVGRRAPAELRPAFDAAHREWLLTTDFARTLTSLKRGLADPAADATCETLLVAHAVGGTDIGPRLEALAEDRRQDVQGRKDARARQAGVRFARRFVLLVPLGMALAGTSVGTGRDAYRTPLGQLMVSVALLMVASCWWWAGRLLRLPETERVFPR